MKFGDLCNRVTIDSTSWNNEGARVSHHPPILHIQLLSNVRQGVLKTNKRTSALQLMPPKVNAAEEQFVMC